MTGGESAASGRASGRALEGCHVVIVGAQSALSQAMVTGVRSRGGRVTLVPGGVEGGTALATVEGADAVVALVAAPAPRGTALHELSLAEWRGAVSAPLRQCFHVAREAVEGFLAEGSAGRLVLIVLPPDGTMVLGSVLAGALRAFARSFAREYGRRQTTCNVVLAPDATIGHDAVVDHALFLASPGASFVNGEVLELHPAAREAHDA